LEQRLVKAGRGRALRYLLPVVSPVTKDKTLAPTVDQDWLSPTAVEIRNVIQRPVARRTPVGQGAFLDAYKANETFYLPTNLRRELAEIGQVGQSPHREHRPVSPASIGIRSLESPLEIAKSVSAEHNTRSQKITTSGICEATGEPVIVFGTQGLTKEKIGVTNVTNFKDFHALL